MICSDGETRARSKQEPGE